MDSLERILEMAHADANRSGEQVAVLNLNHYGRPLYVCRYITPGILTSRELVQVIEPEARS